MLSAVSSSPVLFGPACFRQFNNDLKRQPDRQADRQRLEPEPARTVWGADDKNQTDVQTKHKSGDVKVRSDHLQSARKGTRFFQVFFFFFFSPPPFLCLMSNR